MITKACGVSDGQSWCSAGVKNSPARNSITEIHGRFGVLKLMLGSGEYSHAFIDPEGRVWDPTRSKCH